MGCLIGQLRGRKGGLVKIISAHDIFVLPDGMNVTVEYQPDYKLESDEWFVLSQFSAKEFCPAFLQEKFNSVDYPQIDSADYSRLTYLCFTDRQIFYFQRISPARILHKKWISFSGEPEFTDKKTGHSYRGPATCGI